MDSDHKRWSKDQIWIKFGSDPMGCVDDQMNIIMDDYQRAAVDWMMYKIWITCRRHPLRT